ncbi:hypothetical protein Tco_0504997 [Tanacetum coccineum]
MYKITPYQPPCKRLRDSSSAYHHEVSIEVKTEIDIEDSIETRAEGDIKRDIEDSYETYTKPDLDSDILADIKADIATEAATAIEADTATDVVAVVEAEVKPIEAGNVVAKHVVLDDLLVLTIREWLDELDDIEEEQRAQETRAEIATTKRASLLERVRVLEGSNIRLQDSVGIKRDRIASVERRLGYVSEELRHIRLTHHYDRESFKRLETFMIRHDG